MAQVCKILFLAIIAVIFNSITADYCTLKSCERKGRHTMCIYPPTPSPNCGTVKSMTLTDKEKQDIVNKHNQLRRYVASGQETRGSNGPQPAAINMPDLTWDNELEIIAQRWAYQCNFNHDACRDVERFQVGQNLAISSSSGQNARTPVDDIQSWYDEVDKFDRNEVRSFKGTRGIGHYTQVVWGATTKLGCALIRYDDGGWDTKYLVCNYGPAGNMLGAEVYRTR